MLHIAECTTCLFWPYEAWCTSAMSWNPGLCTAPFPMSSTESRFLLTLSSVQSLSHVRRFVTPWTVAHQASLPITNSWSLLKLMSIELVMPSIDLIFCRPLLLPPAIFPSIRVFSSESVLPIRWPKFWNFGFSISPSNEYSGLICFRMDWLDLPCSPRNSQESSSTPQFKSINS